ncbi:MAG: catalase [Pirellulaceae bacterium]|nr:catalase [Pirellulaceae bacterium]
MINLRWALVGLLLVGDVAASLQGQENRQPVMTTQQGIPTSDNQNSLKAGARGPTLLEDFQLREKLFHFDHERIPERVVHARGSGAHGYFENYESLSSITKADIFQRAGEKTPAFVRFSTVAGSKGSADVARDVRGFAVKLYSKEGNWDIVGNNIPVFFIQDAMKFPDLVHAAKPEPDQGFPQAATAHNNFWDFITLTPESMNMIMWTMSDRTIPRSLRFMEGFGVHTFRLVNAAGESTFVKFHWKPKQGLQSVVWNEAVKINGADPDYHRRDLWTSIAQGNFPEWELGLQLFDEKFAKEFPFDVLDATKMIPEELVPIRKVGRLVLDRNVDNFFAETEQVAFCTQNIVPGIDFSNDPLLQGRNFSYLDTQLKRLGSPNFTNLPINAPRCPIHNFQQDGHMAMNVPKGHVNYEPNSFGVGGRESPEQGFKSYAEPQAGKKERVRSETFADHYSQARQFFISQSPIEQSHIVEALVFELSKVEKVEIRSRMVAHLLNIDTGLANSVATGLRLSEMPSPAKAARPTLTDLKPLASLSIIKNGPKSFAGRTVGILITDGVDADILVGLVNALKQEKAAFKLIAPQVGGVQSSNGKMLAADEKIGGAPSVLYDAIAILPSKEGVASLSKDPAVREFVADALSHRKFIGYVPHAEGLLEKAGADSSNRSQLVLLDQLESAKSFVTQCRNLRSWPEEANKH